MSTYCRLLKIGAVALATHASAQTPALHFEGNTSTPDDFGTRVGGGRDATGDGVPDLIVGIPGAKNAAGTITVGAIEVYSGSDGTLHWRAEGVPSGGDFGASVTMLDDINSDGKSEIAVGTSYALATGLGSVRVLDGGTGSLLYSVTVGVAGDRFGFSLATIGDLNGDGFSEFIAGAPSSNGPGFVAVRSGLDGAGMHMTISSPNTTMDYFGSDVAAIGSIDGDNLDDIVVSAWLVSTAPDSGGVYTYAGSSGGQLSSLVDATAVQFGWSIDTIDDINSDGRPDIVLNAGIDNANPPNERVWICSGADMSVLREFLEPSDYTGCSATPIGYGTNVVGLDDWDGDGRPEIAVCAGRWSGSGNQSGMVLVQRSFDGRVVDSFWGEDSCEYYGGGLALARVGDLNGDSIDDLIIGAAGITSGTVGTGSCPTSLPGYADAYLGGQGILQAYPLSISDASGQSQNLVIDAPSSLGGYGYWVLGSTSGTKPGTAGFGTLMPLNSLIPGTSITDPYWNLTLNNPSGTPLSTPIGTLSSSGLALLNFTLPTTVNWPAAPFVAHAVAIFDQGTGQVLAVSNPVPLGIRGTSCP